MNKRAGWASRILAIVLLAFLLTIPNPVLADGLSLSLSSNSGYKGDIILPPTIGPSSASSITTISVTLNLILVSLNSAATVNVFFEYGTTTNYGSITAVEAKQEPGAFSTNIDNLTPNTTYHFRGKADGGASGMAVGPDVTFTTLKGPATFPIWLAAVIVGAIAFVAIVLFFVLSKKKRKPKSPA